MFTSRKILMALEQVTPVVPQGTFSVTMRKVPLVVLLPQWSWNKDNRSGHGLRGQGCGAGV